MKTKSEDIVSKVNSSIFFKEFTFDKNDFFPIDGKKEFADNVIWLDDILFFIQIKERNVENIKNELTEKKWFENTVLKKAKKQIKDSLDYLRCYDEILIKNRKEKSINIKNINTQSINKIIIYMPNSEYLPQEQRNLKFYESTEIGNIHLFELEDYCNLCHHLHTPIELLNYLLFREDLYANHKGILNIYPEQYILAHFLVTDRVDIIKEEFIEYLPKLVNDSHEFDISPIVNLFHDRMNNQTQKDSTDYYQILKELALLRRYELAEFKKRYLKMIEQSKLNEPYLLPTRFVSSNGCGFVFLPVSDKFSGDKVNGLKNFTELFKYKWKLKRCLGIAIEKMNDFFDITWAMYNYEWKFDEELEGLLEMGKPFIEKPEFKPIIRYKFKK